MTEREFLTQYSRGWRWDLIDSSNRGDSVMVLYNHGAAPHVVVVEVTVFDRVAAIRVVPLKQQFDLWIVCEHSGWRDVSLSSARGWEAPWTFGGQRVTYTPTTPRAIGAFLTNKPFGKDIAATMRRLPRRIDGLIAQLWRELDATKERYRAHLVDLEARTYGGAL
ncbi:MAG TPA: hypothetical protein VF183_07410 [Acidimicrobiales bacterium]